MPKEAVITPTNREAWFDELVSDLRAGEVHDTATAPVKSEAAARDEKSHYQKFFVSQIIRDYVELIQSIDLIRLGLDYNDSEVLVWAEIPDDRDDLEHALIMAEATINATYHDAGFDINTTIVEESDWLAIPDHYKILAEPTRITSLGTD